MATITFDDSDAGSQKVTKLRIVFNLNLDERFKIDVILKY